MATVTCFDSKALLEVISKCDIYDSYVDSHGRYIDGCGFMSCSDCPFREMDANTCVEETHRAKSDTIKFTKYVKRSI